MCDCMRFPDTVEEFMDQYKVVDKEGIYMSKGAELVPIFRMEQWFEHEKAQLSQEGTTKGTTTDTISRQAAIGEVKKHYRAYDNDLLELITFDIERLPSVQPEIIHCGECIYYDPPHVEKENVRYEYSEMPKEAFDVLGTGLVSVEYGINVGGRCCVDYYCKNYPDDKRVYVPKDNYCGRAERRTDG